MNIIIKLTNSYAYYYWHKLLLSIVHEVKYFESKIKTTEKNWRDGLPNFLRSGVYKHLLEIMFTIVYVLELSGCLKAALKATSLKQSALPHLGAYFPFYIGLLVKTEQAMAELLVVFGLYSNFVILHITECKS